MKRLFMSSLSAFALSVAAGGVQAADFEAERAIQGLVVSGIVDSWNGYTFIGSQGGSNANFDPDSYFSSGLSGRLSLPLGDNLSIQMDGDLEYTENAFDNPVSGDSSSGSNAVNGFMYSAQFGAHLTYRDPGMGAFGVFGAFGTAHDFGDRNDYFAVGGEAQLYLDDLTLYLQGGHLDGESVNTTPPEDAFHDALFVRGVARWFMTPDSRLQGEVSYADGEQDGGDSYDMDIIEWSVRYDTVIAGLPLIGDTPVYVGYRGTRYDNEGDGSNFDDGQFTEHTIMVGTSYSFGGATKQEFDRIGATLEHFLIA